MTTNELKTLLLKEKSFIIDEEDMSSDEAIREVIDTGFAKWSDEYDDKIELIL